MLKRFLSWRTYIFGLVCGFIGMSVLTLSSLKPNNNNNSSGTRFGNENTTTYQSDDNLMTFVKPERKLRDEYQGQDVAGQLAAKVRVLCWVATVPNNHFTKAVHVRDTWGKRCNILLFMSSKTDNSLPAVVLDVEEGKEYLFEKTRAAMEYVYKYYRNTIDWVLKSDDDTFVVVENLRYLLSHYDPSQPLYLGCRFKPFTKQGFMSGGGGYVLSRATLKLFVEEAMPNKKICLQGGRAEDVEIGKCLENVNVTAVDTRDELNKGRFFPYSPEFHLFPDHNSQAYDWYWKYQYYPDPEGLDCCSDTAVSFHYISPEQLHTLNYLVYNLRPYGTSIYNRHKESVVVRV